MDWRIEVFETLPSTQAICFERAKDGADAGLVVRALSQSDGKGRQGRVWETGAGNLAFSCVLKPTCGLKDIGQAAIVTGVAIADVISKYVTEDVRLKWPNDVFIDGAKCAGILIESETGAGAQADFIVVGVGVNIQSAPDYAHALNDYADAPIDVDAFLDDLLAAIEARFHVWEREGFEKIRSAWNALSLQEIDENGHVIDGKDRHAARD